MGSTKIDGRMVTGAPIATPTPPAPKPAPVPASPAAVNRMSVADASKALEALQRRLAEQLAGRGKGTPPVTPGGPGDVPGTTTPPRKPAPAPAKVEPTPAEQGANLDGGLALIRRSATGRALVAATTGKGVEIVISTDAGLAHFDKNRGPHGSIVINPAALTDPTRVAGFLAHELGHAYVHSSGALDRLHALPDNMHTLANEVVAETISTAVAQEGGYLRGASAVSRGDGTYRAPAEGFDEILKSDFYVDYYHLDLSTFTAKERQQVYDAVTDESIGLITSLGGTPPKSVTAGARLEHTGRGDGHWVWAGRPQVARAQAS